MNGIRYKAIDGIRYSFTHTLSLAQRFFSFFLFFFFNHLFILQNLPCKFLIITFILVDSHPRSKVQAISLESDAVSLELLVEHGGNVGFAKFSLLSQAGSGRGCCTPFPHQFLSLHLWFNDSLVLPPPPFFFLIRS